jgi:type I restriction enzyme S subunit
VTTGIKKAKKAQRPGLGSGSGQVPIHWAIVPTRAVLKLQRELVGDSWVDRQLLSITKRGIVA